LFAQFFDPRSQRLGDEYRGYIAQNQKVIEALPAGRKPTRPNSFAEAKRIIFQKLSAAVAV
jgi:hypothetical protein